MDTAGRNRHSRESAHHIQAVAYSVLSSQARHTTGTQHLEAVAEVDVQDLSASAVECKVGRVAIAQAQHIAHHGHDGKGASVVRAAVQPHLAVPALEP